MDAQLIALAAAGASALVGAMVTDGWAQAKAATVAFWRRHRPTRADAVEQVLESTRAEIVAVDEAGRPVLAARVEGRWQERFESMIEEHPEIAGELAELLEYLRKVGSPGFTRLNVQRVEAAHDAYVAGNDLRVQKVEMRGHNVANRDITIERQEIRPPTEI